MSAGALSILVAALKTAQHVSSNPLGQNSDAYVDFLL